MPTGRPPKPTEQKRRAGNPGKRKLPMAETIGGRAKPNRPPGLSRHASIAWDVMVSDLHASGVLDRADAGMVEAAAVQWGRARELRDALRLIQQEARKKPATDDPLRTLLDKAGFGYLLAPSARGTTIQPLLSEERRTWTAFRMMAENLALSPTGRARLGMANLARGEVDPIERDIGKPPRMRVVGGTDVDD